MWQLEGVDIEKIRQELGVNRELHDHFIENIKALCKTSHFEDAALLAELLGLLAWQVPCGKYSCGETEDALNTIGGHLCGSAEDYDTMFLETKGPFSRRRVLHVISIPYNVGGHTRAMARMILNTRDRCTGSVIITRCSGSIPEWLKEAVQASGGWLHSLDGEGSLLKRAANLRGLTKSWADMVVLHIHPNDPIPNMAFSQDIDVPVVFFNHADHVFWYGGTVADTVTDIRQAGRDLTEKRRLFRKSLFLPIPLEEKGHEVIPYAKKRLGFNSDDTVLLSIASAYKYKKIGATGFLDIHERIVRKHDRIKLLVVGPELSGEWRECHDRTDGRITALGVRRDLDLYYSCADIYVDSYPFSSLTSLLDAGLYGKPAVGLCNALSPAMSCDDISLNRANVTELLVERYEEALHRLITDRELRALSGQNLKQCILGEHAGQGWLDYWKKNEAAGKSQGMRHPDGSEITYDDIFLYALSTSANNWNAIHYEMPLYLKRFGIGTRSDLFVDNLLKRNFFRRSRISPLHFITKNPMAGLRNGIKKVFTNR